MKECNHNHNKTIVVLQAFAAIEVIGEKCEKCQEIIKIIK